ncbi:MAG: aminotransferase [Eubacteriales bacterium]|nr:aminotransferase [Eubacteriales bacterium]MDN5363066.1 aminotransferase [Eubacteriales bacterium]
MSRWGEYVATAVRRIPPSGIRRFFDLVAETPGVISLGVGEPDFVTPWHIREACIYALERGFTMYTSNYGLLELREAIARRMQRTYGLSYDPRQEILVTVGVSEGLDLALRALLNPGDEVLIPEPCYVSYSPCTSLAGGVPVPVPTRGEDNFRLRAEELEKHISKRTKVLVLSYPNNPTGAIMEREDLLAIADLVEKYDLIVISDEIYDELTYDGQHTCFASLPRMRDRTILLNGFSKAYAMTGWRVGYACGNPEFIGAMTKIHQYTMLCAPITAQMAAIEALNKGEEEMKKMVAAYNRRRRLVVEGLRQIGLPCFEPKGAFYAFPSIRETGLSSEEFCTRLLQEVGVAVVPGNAFGASGEGHVRLSYAASTQQLTEALNRMETFLKKLKRQSSAAGCAGVGI